MKNLNLKSYQAYHPYSIPTNHPNHRNSLQHHLPYPPANSTASASASASASSSQRFYTNSTYNSNDYMPTTTTTITNAIHFPTPPTLGNYLEQQQQQRQQHSHNQQPQQQQQQQQQSQTQTQLGLNQNTICNYNFYFNNNNSPNNTFDNNHNNHSHSNSLNASNHSNSALSRAPQRPQRPTSLNLSSVNSLPNKYSSAACVRTPASTGDIPLNCHLVRSNSNSSNLSNNANNYYNHQRENLFNFPLTSNSNYNNYNFQTFNNYNAVQQQQQQLHQFQLLQQQFKQQQQQQQQQPLANCDIKQSATAISSISNPLSAAYAAAAMTSTATAASTATAVYQSNSNYNSGNTNNNNNKTNNNNNNNNNSNNSNSNNNNNCDKISMDASEIANFLANELFMQQLVSMECMQTGVPTLTTPTLTPTTLKSIEESFIQLTSEPINAPYQAGFIPPPLGSYSIIANNNNNNNQQSATASAISANTVLNNVYLGDLSTEASLQDYGALNDSETENSQGSWMGQHVNEENSMATTDTSSATDTASFQNGLALGASNLNNSNSSTTNDFSSVNLGVLAAVTAAAKLSTNNNTSLSATNTTTTTTRRGGGRRPATNTNISPEEEEKRRVRRERNKLAAARCRKRRVDQTNELTDEVSVLEHKRMELQKQIEQLNSTKQELEFILEQHRPSCQRVVQQDLLNVNTFVNENITGLDTTLASTARSISPIDLKPVLNDQLLAQIKPEPLDPSLDSTSQDSLDDDQDGPPSPKRLLLTNNNPMIPPPLPSISTLSKPMADASASLNTPIVTSAPVSFGNIFTPNLNSIIKPNSKQRPNSLPVPRSVVNQNLLLSVNDNKPPTDINGVAIQTPSTGMFNFDSLMDGGTGLTPVSGPLVPNCSQNKHPLELVTPTSEPSKLVSL